MAHIGRLLTLVPLMNQLTWQDFELVVDLIFARSGWQRVGPVGKTQKTLDIALDLPITREHAFAQVKSETDQAELDGYRAALEGGPCSRMFYVFHSWKGGAPVVGDPRVTLIGPDRLAKLVVDNGRFDISLTLNPYIHVTPDLQREAATKMDAILAGANPDLVTQTESRVN